MQYSPAFQAYGISTVWQKQVCILRKLPVVCRRNTSIRRKIFSLVRCVIILMHGRALCRHLSAFACASFAGLCTFFTVLGVMFPAFFPTLFADIRAEPADLFCF